MITVGSIMSAWYVAYDAAGRFWYVAYGLEARRVGNTPVSRVSRAAMAEWLHELRGGLE